MTVSFGENYVFSVRRRTHYDEQKIIHNYCLRTATQDIIEFDYWSATWELSGIDCMLCASLRKDEYSIPALSNLKQMSMPKYCINPIQFGPLEVYYNYNEMNLCLDDSVRCDEIVAYYSEGRVDFFYDPEGYLVDIRVRDLSDHEYQVLKDEEEDYGHYMKAYSII